MSVQTTQIVIRREVADLLIGKAAALQLSLDDYLLSLAEIEPPIQTSRARCDLDALLAPVRKEFAESGLSEDEFDALIKQERRAMRLEKQGQQN
jgi:hypothetical protein